MARPGKHRNVCQMPKNKVFGPQPPIYGEPSIHLNVDEYEVLRLIDYENLNQEEAAEQMDVARSTIQRIYLTARMKLAQMLVEGRNIHIEGGNYRLCNEHGYGHGCSRGHRNRNCVRKK